jgi:hypothetical protein
METTIAIPTYPPIKKAEVPVKQQTAVERSLARPDAWAKPGTIGNVKGNVKTWVRTTALKPKSGRPRRKKRDPRDIHYF